MRLGTWDPRPRRSPLVAARRRIRTAGTGGRRAAPDALVAAVTVTMKPSLAIGTTVSVARGPAPLAVLFILDMLVKAIRTMDTTMAVARGSAMSALGTHVASSVSLLIVYQISNTLSAPAAVHPPHDRQYSTIATMMSSAAIARRRNASAVTPRSRSAKP